MMMSNRNQVRGRQPQAPHHPRASRDCYFSAGGQLCSDEVSGKTTSGTAPGYSSVESSGRYRKRPSVDQSFAEKRTDTSQIAILLVIIDTFVVTQAINNIPINTISCPLEGAWHGYYNNKDIDSIKTIQDALNCCGLKTLKEQAWPFASDKTPANSCATMFKRDTPCFGPWSKKHQLSAGMFTAVAIVTLMSKVPHVESVVM